MLKKVWRTQCTAVVSDLVIEKVKVKIEIKVKVLKNMLKKVWRTQCIGGVLE